MLHRYNQFRDDLILESLILESKLEFSKKFLSILQSMPKGTVRDELLKINREKTDLNLIQNYIDVSSNKEEITFIPDRRAQQILGTEGEIKWITNSEVSNRYLTFNKDEQGRYKNRSIFADLGFDPKGGEDDHPVPGSGEIGSIVSEIISRQSGKTYVLFKWGRENNEIVLNKVALDPHDDRYEKVWSATRSPIRIGRMVTAILNSSGTKVTDKDKEDFVNQYKSAFDIMNDAFKKFDIVKGKDIAYWYDIENYESTDSTLGSSCMAEVETSYFKLYTKNEEVCSLVILYGDRGEILPDGTFKGKKIRGRALLWKTDQGDMFMDRIYYNKDSDVELFKQFAEKNGWWCKKNQNSENRFYAQKGNETKNPTYTVTLDMADFDEYPYVDTMAYLNVGKKKVSNVPKEIDAEYQLNDTEGGRYEIDEEDY